MGFAIDMTDGVLGADLMAGLGQAALTVLRNAVLLGRAGVAGVVDDVDERRVVVLLRHGALRHAVGENRVLIHRAKGQPHGQPHPLPGDGPLQEDGLPVLGLLSGYDDIGQLLHPVIGPIISQAGHLSEYFLSDIGNR